MKKFEKWLLGLSEKQAAWIFGSYVVLIFIVGFLLDLFFEVPSQLSYLFLMVFICGPFTWISIKFKNK